MFKNIFTLPKTGCTLVISYDVYAHRKLCLRYWNHAVSDGLICCAVWHFNNSAAASCYTRLRAHTRTHAHAHPHTHTLAHHAATLQLSSVQGGSKVVISLFQILIWQQLQPVARLPLGRQSPFKSLLNPHPPINRSTAHPPHIPHFAPPSLAFFLTQACTICLLISHPLYAQPNPIWLRTASYWIHTGQQVAHVCFGISCHLVIFMFQACLVEFDLWAQGQPPSTLVQVHSQCTAWSCRAVGYGFVWEKRLQTGYIS